MTLSKLLALQLLLYQLVESAPFYEFMACATLQWQVLSHQYFAQKAILALHQHVEWNLFVT